MLYFNIILSKNLVALYEYKTKFPSYLRGEFIKKVINIPVLS